MKAKHLNLLISSPLLNPLIYGIWKYDSTIQANLIDLSTELDLV